MSDLNPTPEEETGPITETNHEETESDSYEDDENNDNENNDNENNDNENNDNENNDNENKDNENNDNENNENKDNENENNDDNNDDSSHSHSHSNLNFTEHDLPGVSIITPTYNRRNTIKLSVVNFLSFDYPKDKLEWIIIDDSPVPIRDVLPEDSRIKYYYFGPQEQNQIYQGYKKKLTSGKNKNTKKVLKNQHLRNNGFLNNRLPLGLKRNLGVAYANYDYLVHMDDDDYYPKDSIKTRIFKMLEKPSIQCLGCIQLNQFHTTKLTSIKAKSADDINKASRFYACTLVYTRNFWKRQHFENGDIQHEGTNFLKNRDTLCEIIEPKQVIVGLIHQGNQDMLKGYQDLQPNGWHFEPIPDELFLLITSF